MFFIAVALVLLAGYTHAHVGPQTVARDRFDYNQAISNSSIEQSLLSIVKIRYAGMPLSVEVASMVSGCILERAVSRNGTVSSGSSVPATAVISVQRLG
jgi:hypothetical protein